MSGPVTRLKQVLSKSQFARNVAVLAGSTALSQGLAVLSSPILTRLYTPADFGVLAVYISILSILVTVSSLRYELAIPLPEDDESGASLLVLALVSVAGMSLLVGVGVWLLGDQLVRWVNTPSLRPYLWLLPLSLLGAGAYQAISYWTTRKKHFSLLSYTRAVQAFGRVGIQIWGGLLNLGPIGLIVGYIAGQALGVSSLLRRFHLSPDASIPRKLVKLAMAYKNFPLFTTWASLINVIGVQAPPVLFAKYFALDTVGFFSLTMRVLGLPAALVGQAVAQVFYPAVAENKHEISTTKRFVEQVATWLFVFSFMMFSLIAIHGPVLFAFVFGNHWRDAGRYAQYLAPWFIFSFISSPLSTLVLVQGKQKEAFWITFYETGLRLGAIWLGGRFDSADLAIGLFAVAGTLICLVYIVWVLRLAGSSLAAWLSSIKKFVLVGVFLLTGLFMLENLLNPVISLIMSVGCLSVFGLWFWHSVSKGLEIAVDEG